MNVSGPRTIGENLEETVREMVKELPTGAHHIVVMVYADGLYSIIGAYVIGLPVTFYPTEGRADLVGKVSIGYGAGNLENFEIPPGGCLDVE